MHPTPGRNLRGGDFLRDFFYFYLGIFSAFSSWSQPGAILVVPKCSKMVPKSVPMAYGPHGVPMDPYKAPSEPSFDRFWNDFGTILDGFSIEFCCFWSIAGCRTTLGKRYANLGAEGKCPASANSVHLTTLGLGPGPLGGPRAQHGKCNGV